MPRREIRPVQTQTVGFDPDPHGEVPPSAEERFAALADAVEATADPATPAAAKKAVLDHLRELRGRLGRVVGRTEG